MKATTSAANNPMISATANPFDPIRFTEVRSLGGPVLDLEVSPGSELLIEGEIAGTFFVIRSGTALLVRDDCPLTTLGAGDCFGELDPVAPRPQPYGVITASPVRLLAFSSFGIGRLCDAIPGVGERLRASIAQAPAPQKPDHRPQDPDPVPPELDQPSPTRSRRAAGSSTVTVL